MCKGCSSCAYKGNELECVPCVDSFGFCLNFKAVETCVREISTRAREKEY